MTNKATKYGLMTIAAVLLVAMAFAGAASAHYSGWTDLNSQSFDGGSLPSGMYYLSNDLTVHESVVIDSGLVDLCLNGHILRLDRPVTEEEVTSHSEDIVASVIVVKTGGTLNLYDCSNPMIGKITGGNGTYTRVNIGGTNKDWRILCGNGIFVDGGIVNMYGGNIADNTHLGESWNWGKGNVTGTMGGGVSVGNDGEFYFHGGMITNNTVTMGGGGVFVFGTGSSKFVMYDDASISENYVNSSHITYSDSVENPQPFHLSGGGVFLVGNIGTPEFIIEGGNISRNNVSTTFSKQKVSGGGGIFARSGVSIFIKGGNITENSVTLSATPCGCGGGIYIRDSTSLFEISSGNVSNNLAKEGGGIYSTSSTTIKITGGYVSYNKANVGGGIDLSGGTFEFTNGVIFNNNATVTHGGGLYLSGGIKGTISSTANISFNKASSSGGGIYLTSGSNMLMSGGNIANNTAKNGGGVWVYYKDTTFTMSGGNIAGNIANGTKNIGNGGGVYLSSSAENTGDVYNSTMIISGGKIVDNSAASNGGGIFILKSENKTLSTTAIANLTVFGSPIITGNKNSTTINNVVLDDSAKVIHIVSPLTVGADIGVNVATDRTVADGCGAYEVKTSDLQYFTSDTSDTPASVAFYYNYTEKKIMSGNPAIAVTLHSNNGTDVTETQYVVSDKETPIKDNNFIFANWYANGWNTVADGTGTAYAETVTTTSALDLYAQWTAKLLLDKNGGSEDGWLNVTYNTSSITDYMAVSKSGYTLEGYYNSTAADKVKIIDTSGANPVFCSDVDGYTTGGKWINTTGSAVVLYANLTFNTTSADSVNNVSTFGANNITAVKDAAVVSIVLESVNNVTGTVTFTADNTTVNSVLPSLSGMNAPITVSIFDINATNDGSGAKSTFYVNVTFSDLANKDNVKFFHYTDGRGWDATPLTITIDAEYTDEKKVCYKVETTSFSPFGVGIYTAIPQSSYTSSSSHSTGYTQILSEGQGVPTTTPTAAPTAEPTPATPTVIATEMPTTQATQQSPAPFVGIIAGLGVAALVYRLRK